ncbi:cellulase family glycosylhydrolase [Subtercola sp. Z020]|uniref:cellulase family glycosylhydrolase n=1 Tax=Subtercola sp. Z020 TaxID=2080582 RepID=UPI00130E7792|nr:cellulase family glycosylhydrolase [Subtercola sp. Z020]
MSSKLSRRQLIAGAAVGSAAVAAQVAAGSPAFAASPSPAASAAAAPTVAGAGTVLDAPGAVPSGVRAVTRVASFPVGYSTGSTMLFESKANIAKTLDTIVASGGTTVRFDIMWILIQPNDGSYTWGIFDYAVAESRARGLTILGIITTCPPWAALNGGNAGGTMRPATTGTYAKFAGVVAKRYKGKIAAYEIWNEPNARMYFAPDPDPTFYGQLVRAAYPVIKAADPAATVLAGVMGPAFDGDGLLSPITFLTRMYAAGAAGRFDALSFHPYDYTQGFASATLWDNTAARRMIEMHAIMVKNGDGLKKIWITEYGAPTGTGGVSETRQAALLQSSLQSWGEVSYAGPFYIFTVTDIGGETMGVTTSTFAPKKSLATVTALQASGLPLTARGQAFKDNADPALGASVSVTYPMGGGAVQECENGSRYQTSKGWFSSPTAVATLARLYQFVPITPFANNYQNFNKTGGFRIFYTPATGAHSVAGVILAKWTSALGVATTDEYAYAADGSRANDFVKGRIVWSATTGVVTVTKF